jgi:small subunit ribosomal protein S16
MLVIRYFRIGKKNQPYFRIRVADKLRPPKGGRFVEELGTWSPLTKQKTLKVERIKYWLSVGAQPSDSVYNLLVSEKVIEGKKRDVHKKSKKPAEESKVVAPITAPVTEAPKPAESPTAGIQTGPSQSGEAGLVGAEEPKVEVPAPAEEKKEEPAPVTEAPAAREVKAE